MKAIKWVYVVIFVGILCVVGFIISKYIHTSTQKDANEVAKQSFDNKPQQEHTDIASSTASVEPAIPQRNEESAHNITSSTPIDTIMETRFSFLMGDQLKKEEMKAILSVSKDFGMGDLAFLKPKNERWGNVRYVRDGKSVFAVHVSYDTHKTLVVTNPTQLKDVSDPYAFMVFSGSLASDGTHVYFLGTLQPSIDARTLQPMNEKIYPAELYSDSKSVYLVTERDILDHDEAILRLSNYSNAFHIYDRLCSNSSCGNGFLGYWTDGTTLYFGTSTVSTAHVNNFSLYSDAVNLSILERIIPISYGTDGTNVFYNGVLISGADSNTFIPINGPTYQNYAKDKDHVFFQGEIIPDADPATFKVLAYQRTKGGGCNYGEYAVDANHVFYRAKIIKGADPVTFKNILGNYPYGEDKNGFYKETEKVDKSTFIECSYG